MQKITPFLWFEDKAEEAVNFYTSIFKNSKVTIITRYEEEGAEASGRPQGTVMTMAFQLDGQDFTALNGGPYFKFTEAISFVVRPLAIALSNSRSGKFNTTGGTVSHRWAFA